MKKRMTYLLLMLLPMMAAAQKASVNADIERLTKEMYQFFSTDSSEHFMRVTDSLKAICLKAGDEKTFYKAWSNQANHAFTKMSREKGLAIAREERAYAEKHDSKYGLYASTGSYATMMSSIGMTDEAEKGFLQVIDYQRRFFPNDNAAYAYIGLAKIEHNRQHYEKTIDYGQKTLAEKGVVPIHQLHAYNYILFGLGELATQDKESAGAKSREAEDLKQRFNKAYAERQKLLQEHDLQDATGGIVKFYEAKVNGRYNELPELAAKVVNKSNRLALIPEAWAQNGEYKKAYEAYMVYKDFSDSVNRAEIRQAASEYGVQLDLAKAENEMKDLRLANQEHREHIHHIIMGTVGAIAALIIAFLVFYLHRRNKHSKEIEAAYDKLETAHEKLEDAYNRLEETTAAKERIESELRIAREIQMGMVPRAFSSFPAEAGIDLYASMNPAREVGGDLYDFFLQGNKLYFCVGDVSGKGVPASMTMAVAVNLFRNVAKEGFPPEYIATRLNETLVGGNESGMFVTMFIAEIDLTTGRMNYCNAGHNPPIIVDRPLESHKPCRPAFIEMESNAPIGLWPDLEYVGESLENVKGRTLFLYTDGIPEAENSSHKQFGDERVMDFFKKSPYDNAKQTVDLMNAAVAAFVGDAEPSDDLTMLCLRIA
jgi:serine phosphatase RsbU (regulator of sigma subunit)